MTFYFSILTSVKKAELTLPERVQDESGSRIDFVTNFSEYAPEGYEVDAFRYLAKSELEKKLPTHFEDALAMCRTRQRKVEILCRVRVCLSQSNLCT